MSVPAPDLAALCAPRGEHPASTVRGARKTVNLFAVPTAIPELRICSKCGSAKTQHHRKDRPSNRFACLPCNAQRLKKHRDRVGRTWDHLNPQKRQAHKQVQKAIRKGELIKLPCQRCGTANGVQAHHDDYSKPLDVMWLCPPHHKQRHREIEAANNE